MVRCRYLVVHLLATFMPPLRAAGQDIRGPYTDAVLAARQAKEALEERWLQAENDSARAVILVQAGNQLTQTVANELAPFWMGTPWGFSGTTEVPGEGAIDCGYFVTTLLRDAGVRFIHSSYGSPRRVVAEMAEDSSILASSRYRVLGKLTTDETFLRSWLSGDSVPARPLR